MSSYAAHPDSGPLLALPRLRFAKPAKRPVETIEPREILRWSLDWPLVEGDPRYEPVIGAWKVRIS